MARPQKSGLDYFALDVHMDDAVELIEAEHGLIGFAVLIKLYQKIYSEGYFYKWTDKQQILFSNRVSVDRNTVITIVNDCIKWGIFHEELFNKYDILSSRRIQSHYITATYKRVNVEVVQEYMLIDISGRTNLDVSMVSDDSIRDTSVSDDGNSGTSVVTDDKSTQSKVKESKEKESTAVVEKDEKEENNSGGEPQLSKNVFRAWEELWMFPNLVQKEILVELSEKYSNDLVVAAIKIAGSKDVIKGRAINFIEAVLKEWEDNNVTTLEQAREYQRARGNQKKNYTYNNNKPRKQETLPDWAEEDFGSSSDEIVEDSALQERLEKIRKMREEQ